MGEVDLDGGLGLNGCALNVAGQKNVQMSPPGSNGNEI